MMHMTEAPRMSERAALPRRLALMLCALWLATGCVTQTVKTVHSEPIRAGDALEETQLLDVGIRIFDPNIPDDFEAREEANIIPDVRRAEARFMPQVLKSTLQNSGNWGAVRVIPRDTAAVDLTVTGRIVNSDGELLELEISAVDATGRLWLENGYSYLTSKYVYAEDAPPDVDPFQPLYTRIANDLLEARQKLEARELEQIRLVAEMRFAQEFAPERFDGYVEQNRRGRWTLLRLPAEDDPMLGRIRKVREREHLFIDTLDEYYSEFRRDMLTSYDDYRQFTYTEAVNLRELRAQSRRRTIAGLVAVAGGLAAMASDDNYARNAGFVAVAGGAYTLKSAFDKNAESRMHMEAIRELGTSLEAEVSPHVIELDDRTITLSGTVDEQYDTWRGILRDLYRTEIGLPVAADTTSPAPAEG
jgi:hypothetical protein